MKIKNKKLKFCAELRKQQQQEKSDGKKIPFHGDRLASFTMEYIQGEVIKYLFSKLKNFESVKIKENEMRQIARGMAWVAVLTGMRFNISILNFAKLMNIK